MADPLLIPIPDLPPAPGTWDLDWPLAIANPSSKQAYKLAGGAFTEKLIESGAIAEIRNPKFYIAGRGNPGDPAAGDTHIVDATLEGYTFSDVQLRGFGSLDPASEYGFDEVSTITIFDLDPDNAGNPRPFNAGDVVKVTFEPKISSYVSAPGSIGKQYTARKRYTTDAMILPDDYQKLQEVVATDGAKTITLPPGSNYPAGVRLTITTNFTNTYQTIILAQGTDVIYITAVGKDRLILGVDEQVSLIWLEDDSTSGWSVDYISHSYKMVGQLAHSFIPLLNAVPLIGGQINVSDQPRVKTLIDAIIARNGPGAIPSYALWDSDPFKHRSKWCYGPSPGIYMIPDWRGLVTRTLPGERTGIDVTRVTAGDGNVNGSFEMDDQRAHAHKVSATNDDEIIARHEHGSGGRLGLNNSPGGWEKAIANITQSVGGLETRPINGGAEYYQYI
ncbi:hypothetical protein ACE38W_14485 [Chitinophaga sp. Hz27]|uniref:hypothetical protein n=1 Tax=Chitinophaga sp. Hz27 TaxID=3347169 RepID=UPI0035D92AAA